MEIFSQTLMVHVLSTFQSNKTNQTPEKFKCYLKLQWEQSVVKTQKGIQVVDCEKNPSRNFPKHTFTPRFCKSSCRVGSNTSAAVPWPHFSYILSSGYVHSFAYPLLAASFRVKTHLQPQQIDEVSATRLAQLTLPLPNL